MVSGADTSVTRRSAVHNANSRGFFTRVVDCEQSEMSRVEFPNTPLKMTIPYVMMRMRRDSDVSSSPSTSSKKSSSASDSVSVGSAVVVLVLARNEIFLDAFLIGAILESHCFSSIAL